MSGGRKLDDLCAISRLMADRALLPVAEAQARLKAVEARLEAVAHHRAQLQSQTCDPALSALMARQAERLRHGQAAVLREMADLRVELERRKATARPMVGRRHALDALREKQRVAQARDTARRDL